MFACRCAGRVAATDFFVGALPALVVVYRVERTIARLPFVLPCCCLRLVVLASARLVRSSAACCRLMAFLRWPVLFLCPLSVCVASLSFPPSVMARRASRRASGVLRRSVPLLVRLWSWALFLR